MKLKNHFFVITLLVAFVILSFGNLAQAFTVQNKTAQAIDVELRLGTSGFIRGNYNVKSVRIDSLQAGENRSIAYGKNLPGWCVQGVSVNSKRAEFRDMVYSKECNMNDVKIEYADGKYIATAE
jgi:hypothetical protein